MHIAITTYDNLLHPPFEIKKLKLKANDKLAFTSHGQWVLVAKNERIINHLEDLDEVFLLLLPERVKDMKKVELITINFIIPTAAKANMIAANLHPLMLEHKELLAKLFNMPITAPAIVRANPTMNKWQARILISQLEEAGIFKRYASFWKIAGEIRTKLKILLSEDIRKNLDADLVAHKQQHSFADNMPVQEQVLALTNSQPKSKSKSTPKLSTLDEVAAIQEEQEAKELNLTVEQLRDFKKKHASNEQLATSNKKQATISKKGKIENKKIDKKLDVNKKKGMV